MSYRSSHLHNSSFRRKQSYLDLEQKLNTDYKNMQVSLDLFIQNSLYRFKFVDYSEQILIHHDNLSIYVVDQKSNLPDLVIYNKIFNKNNCFFDFRGREFYPFPRVTFKITKEIMTKIDSSHLFENEETLSFPQLLDNLTEKSDKLEIIPNILDNPFQV